MFETMMHEYAFKLLFLMVCAIAAAVGFGCRKIYKRHVDSEEKEAIASAAAAFVEQAFKNLHGYDKLMQALDAARVLLAERGIKFSAEEMKILIEAAVGQFNDVFNRDAFNSTALNAGSDKTLDTGDEEAPVFEEELLLGVPLFEEKPECTPNDT